jgi:hypothetical protein
MDLFAHVPRGDAEWDGHTVAEKYGRLDVLTQRIAAAKLSGTSWVMSPRS